MFLINHRKCISGSNKAKGVRTDYKKIRQSSIIAKSNILLLKGKPMAVPVTLVQFCMIE